MRSVNVSRLVAIAATVCAVLVLSPLVMAAPTGTISFGITPGGGVTGSATLLTDWYLPVGAGFGDFTTGGGSVTFNGGTTTSATNPYGQIKDITASALFLLPGVPITNFLQFYTIGSHNPAVPGSGTLQTFPTWDLFGVGPPAAVDCATNPGFDVPCSMHITAQGGNPAYISPLVLTQNAQGGTDVRLDMLLTGRDSSGGITWTGLATANVPNMTPFQIGTQINAGNSVDFQSWSLAITSVPEPATITLALIGVGLMGVGAVRRRRK